MFTLRASTATNFGNLYESLGVNQWTGGYIISGGSANGVCGTYTWEIPVTLKAKQFAVIAVGTGSIVGAHDDEAEAVAQAGRLAAKNDAEYLVLKPVRLLRQKPVDIEDVAL